MANRDLPVYIMQYQKLKLKFPEIPDNIILKYAKQFPEDTQKCIHYLNELKKTCDNRTNKNNNVNQMPDLYSAFVPNRANLTNQMPLHSVSNSSNLDSYAEINGISGPASMSALTPGSNPGRSPKYGHSSGARSSSVSAVSTAHPGVGEFHSNVVTPHPQSAPVMPAHYEPFRAEVSIRPSIPLSSNQVPYMPLTQQRFPVHHENFYESPEKLSMPYGQFKYEMHLQYNQAVISHQQAQMARLHDHLMGEKQRLEMVKSDVYALEEELKRKRSFQNSIFPYEKIEHLREETRRLRIQCDTMSKEVDSLVKGNVPLGETCLDFYENINPGQSGSVGVPHRHHRSSPKTSHPTSITPPTPPPLPSNEDEHRQWSCSTCTFLNNIALDKCEICEMPRLPLASNFT